MCLGIDFEKEYPIRLYSWTYKKEIESLEVPIWHLQSIYNGIVYPYSYLSTVLCENCYMAKLMPRVRKMHWQYLKSIKTDYLRPGKIE